MEYLSKWVKMITYWLFAVDIIDTQITNNCMIFFRMYINKVLRVLFRKDNPFSRRQE